MNASRLHTPGIDRTMQELRELMGETDPALLMDCVATYELTPHTVRINNGPELDPFAVVDAAYSWIRAARECGWPLLTPFDDPVPLPDMRWLCG